MDPLPFTLPPLPNSSDSDVQPETAGSRDRRSRADSLPRFFGEASTIDISVNSSAEGATECESEEDPRCARTLASDGESFGLSASGMDLSREFPETGSLTVDHLSSEESSNEGGANGKERFAILEPLARGGLGQVFLAQDKDFGRRVALKEIQERHASNPRVRARFAREAAIAGNLEHPGIVPVYAIGKHRDGRPYYVMRLIRGESFKEAIRKFHQETGGDFASSAGALGLRKLLIRFLDACHAIAYAHSQGVAHRDIKPSNIMIGEFGETSVVDWGLAKAEERAREGESASTSATIVVDPAVNGAADSMSIPGNHGVGAETADHSERTPAGSSSRLAQTAAGAMFGTPEYMSPEQATGRVEEIGSASDIFGLGATLFAILTSRPPYQGGDVNEIVRKATVAEIPSPRSLKPDIPRELDAICRKATAKRLEDRYPTVTALSEDIERWMAGAPVAALPEGVIRRVRRKLRKHRSLVAAAGIVALLAAVALAIVTMVLHQTNQKLDAANYAERNAKRIAQQRFRHALQAIGSNLTGLGSEAIALRPELHSFRKQQLGKVLGFYRELQNELVGETLESEIAENQELLADAYVQIGFLSSAMGSSADADEGFSRGIDLLFKLKHAPSGNPASAEQLRLKMAKAYFDWGMCVFRNPDPPATRGPQVVQALPRFQQVRELLNESVLNQAERSALMADSWRWEGHLELERNHREQAARCFDQAIMVCRNRVNDASSSLSDLVRRKLMAALYDRAKLHSQQHEHDGAVDLLKGALAHSADLLNRPGAPDLDAKRTVALIQSSMAENLGHLDQFDQGLRHSRDSIQGLYSLLASESGSVTRYSDLAEAFLVHAWLNELSGKTEQAELDCEQALRMYMILSNVDSNNANYASSSANIRFNLAELAWERGYAVKAKETAIEAAQTGQGLVSGRQRILAALALKEYEEAIRIIGNLKLSADSTNPYEAACLLSLASSEISARDVRNRYGASTRDYADRALAILLKSIPKPKPEMARRAQRDHRLDAIRDRDEFQQWIQKGRE